MDFISETDFDIMIPVVDLGPKKTTNKKNSSFFKNSKLNKFIF